MRGTINCESTLKKSELKRAVNNLLILEGEGENESGFV